MPERLAACRKAASAVEWVPLQLFDFDVKLAEKDLPILCGAIAARADYLLTGDKKDFGHLAGRTIGGVKIVSIQPLLADLIAQGLIKESSIRDTAGLPHQLACPLDPSIVL